MNTITHQMQLVSNIDLELFYSVEFTRFDIRLQGNYSFEKRKYCESLGFEFELTPDNYIRAEKNNVRIILSL